MNKLCRQKKIVTLLTLLCAVMWGVAPVSAEMGAAGDMDADVDDAESYQRMLELSAEGNEFYEAGQLQEAADAYSKAYASHPQPILLKNEMIARYLLEECERAIELGEEFIATGEGSASDHEDTEAVFGECSLDLAEAAIEDDRWTVAEDWLDFGEPHWFEAQLREDGEQLRNQLNEHIGASNDEIDEIDDPGMARRDIAGWAATGAGVVTLVGTGLWHISWERKNREFEQLEQDFEDGREGVTEEQVTKRQRELQDSYGIVSWAIPTMYAVGALSTAAGITLLVWQPEDGADEAGAMIQPVFGGDEVGAVFTLTF